MQQGKQEKTKNKLHVIINKIMCNPLSINDKILNSLNKNISKNLFNYFCLYYLSLISQS